MKALFYTATAVFITLAGIIAYFALQSPASVGGARVVLDIDVGNMPASSAAATSSNSQAAFDPYPGAEEDKPAEAETAEPVEPAAGPETVAETETAAEGTSEIGQAPAAEEPAPAEAAGPSHAEAAPSHADHALAANAPSQTAEAPEAAPQDVPPPPPGTALAGLSQDRPLFREVEPETRQQTAAVEALPTESAPPSAAPAQAGAPAAEEPKLDPELEAELADPMASAAPAQTHHAAQPGPETSRLAAEEPAPREAAPAREAASAQTRAPAVPTPEEIASLMQPESENEVQAAAPPPAPPPPPIPVRRPNGIPAPGERVAAAGEGSWAGVQLATTQVQGQPQKTARVAILLRNVGRYDTEGADALGGLPSAISLGFWPYAPDGKRLAARAQERGHEIIVQLPLEPADYPASNPGPDTLLTTAPPEQNAQRLEAVLKRFEGNSGVTNLMGGKMLQSKAALKPVLEELKARGLIYVGESNNTHGTVRQLARELNLRFGAAEVMIDAQPRAEAIDKALARLVSIAKQRGSAIGIGSASVITMQQVHEWSDTLAAQGVTLVPVGALTNTPGSS